MYSLKYKRLSILKRLLLNASGFALMGLMLGRIFEYGSKVMLARTLGKAGYGNILVGLSTMMITASLAAFGLQFTIPRIISYYRGRGENDKGQIAIIIGRNITLATSTLALLILSLFSGFIAKKVFGLSELKVIIQIFGFSLPFFVIAQYLLACLRGLKETKQLVFSEHIFYRGIRLFLIWLFFYSGFRVIGAATAYLLSSIFLGIIAVIFYKIRFQNIGYVKVKKSKEILLEILAFSGPLVLSSILNRVQPHIDTVLLGSIKQTGDVGVYGVAFPIAQILVIVLSAFMLRFVPVSAELYGAKNFDGLGALYKKVTQYCFYFTLVAFLPMLFFSSSIIRLMFGDKYIAASPTLKILSVGYLINSLVGPAGSLIITIGKLLQFLIVNIISIILTISLDVTLIPRLGFNGSAISHATSIAVKNIILLILINRNLGLQPFNLRYVVYLLWMVVPFSATYYFVNTIGLTDIYKMILCFLVLLISVMTFLIVHRSELEF